MDGFVPDPGRHYTYGFEEWCIRCGEDISCKDKYCRFCGKRRWRANYISSTAMFFRNMITPGMPENPKYSATFVCKKCGFSWHESIVYSDPKFCPKCRGGIYTKDYVEYEYSDYDWENE